MAQPSEADVKEFARTKSEPEIVQEASRMTQDGFLYFADILVDKLLTFNSTSPNYNYRKGFLLLNLDGDYATAIPHFQIAVSDIDPNYDMYSHREKSAPTDAYYHLGRCYHLDEALDKAQENYRLFLAKTKNKSELIPVAELKIIQCDVARGLIASPVNVTLTNLSFNSSMPEYSPVVSLDGTSIYFTSRRELANDASYPYKDWGINQYPEDVYVSNHNMKEDTWSEPNLLNFCLPKRNEATMAVSVNERRILLYEDSTGSGDVFFTDFYSGKFQEIERFPNENINSKFWESHATASPDGKKMYISSDRPGGYGGRDIYVSTLLADGKWSDLVNLGPNVNTKWDEDAPFISVDNRNLYFASNGEKSMGEFDILLSEFQVDGSLSPSKNIGYPFNATNQDLFYTTTTDGLRGYMATIRESGKGEKDIYEIKNDFLGVQLYALFKGLVRTSDGSPLPEDFALNFTLTCNDCENNNTPVSIFPRLSDGIFTTGLKECKTYQMSYIDANTNNVMLAETFTTDCTVAYQEIFRELILDVPSRTVTFPPDTVPVIDTIVASAYKNIEFIHYFNYNENKLTVSKGDLKKFVKSVEDQLKEGRGKITINVYSSASQVPTTTYDSNETLTKLRAENMKYDLSNYFNSKAEFAGKVNVTIVTAIVDGPEYVKDFKDKKKYKPYQFVGLKTE